MRKVKYLLSALQLYLNLLISLLLSGFHEFRFSGHSSSKCSHSHIYPGTVGSLYLLFIRPYSKNADTTSMVTFLADTKLI